MEHFLHDIEIKNFKSIRHQKIEGCKRINVFIGYPNVGKSNILEAIGLIGLFNVAEIKNEASLKDFVRVEVGSEVFFEGNTNEFCSIIFNDILNVFAKYSKQKHSLFVGINSSKSRLEYVIDFNGQLEVEKESIRKLKRERPHSFKNGFQFEPDKKIAIKRYSFKPGIDPDMEVEGALMFPFGENMMRILNEDNVLRNEVSKLFLMYNLKLALDKSSGNIKVIRDYGDATIFLLPYSLIADTLQRLIFYKAAIASNQNTVLLFEEPEAHMFPPYISKMTSDIWNDNSNQYFLTTHSPFVINDFLENAREELSLYAVGYKDGETVIHRLTDEQVHEAYQFGLDLFMNLESYVP